MDIPEDLLYTNEDEWVRIEDEIATVGITDYAQKQLEEVVYVELPAVGTEVETNDSFGSIESVKSVSELFSPANGVIEEVNEALEDKPELVHEDPYGKGWMVKIKLSEPPEDLLGAKEYREKIS